MKDNLLGRIWPTGVKLGLYGDVVFENLGRVGMYCAPRDGTGIEGLADLCDLGGSHNSKFKLRLPKILGVMKWKCSLMDTIKVGIFC